MAESVQLTDMYDLSLLECCSCRTSYHDPIVLSCLHNYCSSCLETSACRTHLLKLTVKCCACPEVTELDNITADSFLSTYKRTCALFSEIVCCNICETGEVTAEFWCVDCCKGLCSNCYSRHRLFLRHHRSAELKVACMWPLRQLMPTIECSIHTRQMEVQCFTCSEPKCLLCYVGCRAGGHDLEQLSHDKTRQHLSSVMGLLSSAKQRLSRLVLRLQQKQQALASRLQADRTGVHRKLMQRRQRLKESAEKSFARSGCEVCVNLERLLFQRPDVAARAASLSCTTHIEVFSATGVRQVQLFCERHLLKAIAARCSSFAGASIWKLTKSWKEDGSISIGGSAPQTADTVLSACLGATGRRRGGPCAPLLFRQASVTFQTPIDCWDIAVIRDGHVLLAAREFGLLVYSDRGQQLSIWRQARRSDWRDDAVYSVVALSDGRAAVGLGLAQLVVLLRRSSETSDTWLEDRHVAALPSPPGMLAVHSDLLAALELRIDEEQRRLPVLWIPGPQLHLVRLSSGQVLYRQSRDYDIRRVALTALCVITTSNDQVKRNSGVTPYVIDAFSHSGEFLWRHETSDEEFLTSVCSAETWSRVYVTLWRTGDGSSRVMAIGAADGRDKRDVISSTTHGLQLPDGLSLARGQRRTILAVLNWHSAAKQNRTVTVFEAMSQ